MQASLISSIHTYVKSTSVANHALTIDEIPSHTHNLKYETGGRATGTYPDIGSGTAVGSETTASTGGGQGHSHNLNSTTANTSSVGSAQAIDITPSSVAFYMWQRTA